MARSGTARADSGSSRTWLIHASSTACGRYTGVAAVSVQPLPSSGLGNRILRAETGGRIQAQSAGERPEFGSQTGRGPLTYRNCGHFSHPGNPVGLPGLRGGAEGIRTSDLRSAGTRALDGAAASGIAGLTPEAAPLNPDLGRAPPPLPCAAPTARRALPRSPTIDTFGQFQSD
jgi:hypothetical protein